MDRTAPATILALAEATVAHLNITAKWRPGDISRALRVPSHRRASWLLRELESEVGDAR